MLMSRRAILALGAGSAFTGLTSARAATYPANPIHWVVGAAAGSAPDTWARIIGERLGQSLGQSVVVDNRPGAGGNVAAGVVVHAAPDGYTLAFVTSANSINATLYKSLPFNFIRDIAPVAGIARSPLLLLVNPSFPAKSAAELIAYAKKNPGKINLASAGNGTVSHLCGELLKMEAGIDLHHVPYRSGPPAITDLLAGHVDVMFDLIPPTIGHVRSNRLRAIAVTTATRSGVMPEVPPLAETVPGFDASALFGVGAPRHTPPAVIETLNKAVNAALVDPSIKERFKAFGSEPLILTPAAYETLIAEDTAKWRKAVEFSGARVD